MTNVTLSLKMKKEERKQSHGPVLAQQATGRVREKERVSES